MLDELTQELAHVALMVLCYALLEWVVLRHLRLDILLIEWHELISKQLVHVLAELSAFLETAGVVCLRDVHEVHLLVVVRRDQQVNQETVESALLELAAIGLDELLGQISLSLVGGVVNGLVRLACVQNHLLVHVVADHELVKLYLQLLEASLIQVTS